MKNSITLKNTIFINKPKSMVWDYTQNYEYRPVWDKSVLSTEVLKTSPNRMVRLRMKGNTTLTFVYKLDERPNKTTLKAIDIVSAYIKSAGGSWSYEELNGRTLWTRVDTIVFNESIFIFFFKWLLKWLLLFQTANAMVRVKQILEKD